MMETKIKNASVKVMLSFDYSHFEVSMSLENDNGLTLKEIDEFRKNCNRLADKAVAQYKKAKDKAARRIDENFQMKQFEQECLLIKAKDKNDRTINEMAKLKQYEDEAWRDKFNNDYDYEDDDDDRSFVF